MEAIHEEAQALYEAGAIDQKRMEEYDRACCVSEPKQTYSIENSTSNASTDEAQPIISDYLTLLT